MAGDDRFRMMFYEEARELLIGLEEGLVELERRQGDRAHLDRTFRAAHSIKGAAAMVGLPAIAEFTHGIEAVLDRIRSGSIGVDSDIITTLLESRDHLAAMVEAEAANAPIPPSADLNQRLAAMVRGGEAPPAAAAPTPKPAPEPALVVPQAAPAPEPEPEPEPAPEPEPGPPPVPKPKGRARKAAGEGAARSKPRKAKAAQAAGTGAKGAAGAAFGPGETHYHITFRPGPDLLRRGMNPLGVLDELRELGPTRVTTDPRAVPPLAQLDPERCYLCWEVELDGSVPSERLDDVFLFLGDETTVNVERRKSDGSVEARAVPHGLEAFAPPPGFVAAAPRVAAPARKGPPSPAPAPAPASAPTPPPAPAPASAPSPPPAAAAAPPAAAAEPLPAAPPPAPGPALAPAAAKVMPGVGQAPAARSIARIRVDAHQLDDLVGLAGELAVLSDNLQGLREVAGAGPWVHTLEALERVSRQVRDTTLDLRMVPVDELFSRFPRVVRDLADRFGKEIELRIVGQETRLDRTIVERLSDPMIHLIRNAVDHALESPEERVSRGKPRRGRITLSAGHEGDRVAIRVEDDGRGLDRERIVRKGIGLGLVPVGTSPDDPRVVTLIFEPGFSTRDRVSDLSGRGVGLDVVRDAVRALRGSLGVESAPGLGTSFVFRLPLTLALIDGLLVEAAGNRYVVPLAQVEECVALNGSKPALSRGRPCVAVRGELVPMVPLRRLFRADGPPPPRQELLLTRHGGQRVGVAVDRLLGRVQAVIQALGEGLAGLNRFSGATILGDGSVSLILDLAALVSESRTADQLANSLPPDGAAGRAEGFR